MKIADIFLTSLVSKGAEATIEEVRVFLKSFFSKGTDRTATELCEVVQKHYHIGFAEASEISDELIRKGFISYDAKGGRIVLMGDIDSCTEKTSIKMRKGASIEISGNASITQKDA